MSLLVLCCIKAAVVTVEVKIFSKREESLTYHIECEDHAYFFLPLSDAKETTGT
jgi:hypothetical protein